MPGTENGYAEVTLLVEGAYEETLFLGADDVILYSDRSAIEGYGFDKWLNLLEQEATDKAFAAEVYVLEHGHPFDDEDAEEDTCAQYVTDHHPRIAFGTADES